MIVYLGIGSNIDAKQNIQNAKAALKDAFSSCQFSRTFQSEAVGFKGEDFLNLVAKVETSLSLETLIEEIKQLEDRLGRVRGGEKFSSRTIDIDILLYGEQVSEQPIVLPREEILENAYVLWPLAEMSPELIAPGTSETYGQLWRDFDKSSSRIHALED